jgi:hypothetical protein
MQMRRYLTLASLCCLFAATAMGFAGYEHSAISNIALKVAIKISGNPDKGLAKLNGNSTFGDITMAVDWFQGPEILTDPEILDNTILQRGKPSGAYWKLLADHYDNDHFQRAALEAYTRFHNQALAHARRDRDLTTALLCEAVALHYLQDFLAGGHIVTPRSGFNDVTSGSIHDTYNRIGVPMILRPAWKATVCDDTSLSEPPALDFNQILRELCTGEYKFDAGRTSENVEITKSDVASFAVKSSIQMFGDGFLNSSCATDQKVLLVLLSSQSIIEVIDRPSQVIRTCFDPRTQKPNGTKTNVKGGFGLVTPDQAFPDVVGYCSESKKLLLDGQNQRRLFAEYDLSRLSALTRTVYSAPGFSFRYSPGWAINTSNRQAELSVGRILVAKDPNHTVQRQLTDGHITPDSVGYDIPWSYAAVQGVVARGDGYRAFGIDGELAFQVGTTESILAGVRRYEANGKSATRPEFGVKISAGFQVVNLDVVIQRAHRFDSKGRLLPQVLVIPGIDFNIAPGWLTFLKTFGKG